MLRAVLQKLYVTFLTNGSCCHLIYVSNSLSLWECRHPLVCKLIALQNLNEMPRKVPSFSESNKGKKVLFPIIDLTRVVVSKYISKYVFYGKECFIGFSVNKTGALFLITLLFTLSCDFQLGRKVGVHTYFLHQGDFQQLIVISSCLLGF